MNIYSSIVKACTKNILAVKFMTLSKNNRFLLALMLTGLAFLPTKSFSGEIVLCNENGSEGGTILNSKGQGSASVEYCKNNPYSFVLTDTEDSGLTDVHVIVTKNGTLDIKAKNGMIVDTNMILNNNRIAQLKPRLLSKNSKDAINGSQLFSTNENVNKNADNILKNTQSIEETKNDLNKVNSSLTENKDSITNLTNNINSGKSGLVRQSETDGTITVAAETHGESVSVNGTQGPRFLRDVKAGVNNNDAVNVSQLNKLLADNQMSVAPSSSKEKSQATKKDSLALGGGAKSTAEGAIAIGAESKAACERGIALGQQANSGGSDSLALGAGSSAPGQNAVALGANSVADRNNSVSVGSTGYERQITNVAPGTHDTDAANISQLNSVRSTATSAHGLAQKNTSRINNLENQLSQTNKKIDRGLAASAALTGLFQPYGVGNVNFTAGMGVVE